MMVFEIHVEVVLKNKICYNNAAVLNLLNIGVCLS